MTEIVIYTVMTLLNRFVLQLQFATKTLIGAFYRLTQHDNMMLNKHTLETNVGEKKTCNEVCTCKF